MSTNSSTDIENMTIDELRQALARERELRLRAETALALTQTDLAKEKARLKAAEARAVHLERECFALKTTILQMRDQVSTALDTLLCTSCAPFRTCREEMLLYSSTK
jgi:hypothetical protein